MKTKILAGFLVILSAALIFETGYLMGLNGNLRINRFLHDQPRATPPKALMPLVDREDPRGIPSGMKRIEYMQPFMPAVKEAGPFFVTAMSSRNEGNARIIEINLPGVNKESINIEVKGRQLIIKALQRKEERVDRDGFYKEAASLANFMQVVALPENAKIGDISASYSKEILTITIPRSKEAKKPAENITRVRLN